MEYKLIELFVKGVNTMENEELYKQEIKPIFHNKKLFKKWFNHLNKIKLALFVIDGEITYKNKKYNIHDMIKFNVKIGDGHEHMLKKLEDEEVLEIITQINDIKTSYNLYKNENDINNKIKELCEEECVF